MTISVLSPRRPSLRVEYVAALLTFAAVGEELRDPSLEAGSGEFQINELTAHPPYLLDAFLSAFGASIAFDFDSSVRTRARSFQRSTLSVYGSELRMRPYKYLFTLVIKVGALAHELEVFQSVLFLSKQLPAWSLFNHLLSANYRRQNFRNCRFCGIEGGESSGEIADALQRLAIVLIVSNQLRFEVWVSVCFPLFPPHYRVEACCVLVRSLASKKVSDVFETI